MIIDFLIKIVAFFVSLIPHRTVVVDTETTGLYGELLQVSLVSGSGRKLFNKYIKPDTATEWKEAQKINKISPIKVRHCRHFSSYVPLVNAYLKHTRYLVGFNVSGFDLPILENYGIHTNAEVMDVMLLDSDKRSAKGKGSRWRKLPVVAREYGYLFSAHDSLEDCYATLHVYVLMRKGFLTALYFARKIIRIIAGMTLIGLTYAYMPNIKELAGDIAIALPYAAASCWCYVYGPFSGILSVILAMLFCTNGLMPIVPTLCVMAFLCALYIYVKLPHITLMRFILCFAANIIAGMIGLMWVPSVFVSTSSAALESMYISGIVAGMAVLSPFYLIANTVIKRIL